MVYISLTEDFIKNYFKLNIYFSKCIVLTEINYKKILDFLKKAGIRASMYLEIKYKIKLLYIVSNLYIYIRFLRAKAADYDPLI